MRTPRPLASSARGACDFLTRRGPSGAQALKSSVSSTSAVYATERPLDLSLYRVYGRRVLGNEE